MRWLHFSLGYTRNKEVCVHLILYYILLLTTLINWIIYDKNKLILICNLCRHLGNIFRFESMSKSHLNKKFMGHYKLNICQGLIFHQYLHETEDHYHLIPGIFIIRHGLYMRQRAITYMRQHTITTCHGLIIQVYVYAWSQGPWRPIYMLTTTCQRPRIITTI